MHEKFISLLLILVLIVSGCDTAIIPEEQVELYVPEVEPVSVEEESLAAVMPFNPEFFISLYEYL